MPRIRFCLLTAASAALFFVSTSIPAFSDSQVRIVRLSYIEGGVQVDRGSGYEKAITNLPVAQGTKLRTADDGRAEIEFEDGSTLRITPKTEVEFPQLSLRDSGGKVSTAEVVKGTAYMNYAGAKNDEFTVVFGQEKVGLAHSAHFRIGTADSAATVAVFKGDVQIAGPSGTVDVKKNQTASFDLSANDQYKVTKNIDQLTYDSWDKQQSEYHVRYANNSYNSYSPYAYGTTDLAYYGNFFNAPVPLGMDTLSLRELGLLGGIRLGLAAGWRLDAVVRTATSSESPKGIRGAPGSYERQQNRGREPQSCFSASYAVGQQGRNQK